MEPIENKDLFSLFSWSLKKKIKKIKKKNIFFIFFISLFTFPGVQQDGIYRK